MHTLVVRVLLLSCLAACSASPVAPTPGAEGFDGNVAGWNAASTGGSGPVATWQVRADAGAVSAPNVCALTATNHASEDRFNLYWSAGAGIADGRIAVAVRADGGALDQGGGPMWRVQDPNNYYLCRLNPLESNFRVYVVKDGVRKQLGNAHVEAQSGKWYRLEATFAGDHVTCAIDGVQLLDVRDAAIAKGGGVGLWTKADARTSFDDLVIAATKK